MLNKLERQNMIERQSLLYIGYITEGVEGDYLRQLIHTQILHEFAKFGLDESVDELLHNLDRIGFTSDKITECKYRGALKQYYADLLAKELIELFNTSAG